MLKIRRRRVAAILLLSGMAIAWLARPYVNALALVIDVSGRDVSWRGWLPVRVLSVAHEDITIPTRHGAVVGRLYRPQGATTATTRAVMVVPGLHSAGVEEPRLDRLSTRLAATGMTVLSLPVPDLRRFVVTPESTDVIEDAANWMSNQAALSPSGRISLIGISFGGGLSLVAAGRPSLAGKLDSVVSFGGHGDLPRVLRYLSTGLLPDGTRQPAHDYGTVIFLLAALPHLVPAEQAPALDHAVRVFLDASMVDVSDPTRAAALFRDAATLGAALPEPARSVMADVSARDTTRLGPRLLALAEIAGGNPALSPEGAPVTLAPVFLVHGSRDTVIPQTETPSLAAFYDRSPARQGAKVTWLLTPAVSHADATQGVTVGDVWRLVKLWVEIFR